MCLFCSCCATGSVTIGSTRSQVECCECARLLQESLGPFGPEVSWKCPRECPRKQGCPTECPTECLRGPLPPGSRVSRKCPESVPGACETPSGHSRDTPGTLFGHCGAQCSKGPGDTPWGTPLDTPVFGDTLVETLGTLRARRARETPVAGGRVSK